MTKSAFPQNPTPELKDQQNNHMTHPASLANGVEEI